MTLTCRFVLSLTLLTLTPALQSQNRTTLPLDPAASTLKWTGHAEVGSYAPSGTLKISRGEVLLDGSAFKSAAMTIDMTSLQQSNADLTHHLKSADFFDVEHFPTSELKLDSLSGNKVRGTLTVRGKSAPIEAQVHVTQTAGAFIIAGQVRLDRTKYGVVYNSKSVFSGLGDKAISNYFEVEFHITGKGTLPPGIVK